MSHCGWNSVVESAVAGVQMVTFPLHSDQMVIERLVVEVHDMGVEAGVEEWGLWVQDERRKVVGREKIEKAIRRSLVDEGEEGDNMRRRARELSEKGREAVKEGGSSCENLKTLVRELQDIRDSNNNARIEAVKEGAKSS